MLPRVLYALEQRLQVKCYPALTKVFALDAGFHHDAKTSYCTSRLPFHKNVQAQFNQFRYKYSKKSSKQDEDSESEDEEEFKDERDSKVVKVKVNSLRADLLLKSGLNLARNNMLPRVLYALEQRLQVKCYPALTKVFALDAGFHHDAKTSYCTSRLPFHKNVQAQFNQFRYKYSKKSSKQDEDSESEDEEEFKDERDSKVVKVKVNSLRADLLLKSGLNLARNKIEVSFYESKIRINGKKPMKKSVQLDVGDEVDVIKGFSTTNPNLLVIARIVILSANERDEGYSVLLRRYKSLLIENYDSNDLHRASE